MPKRNIIIIMTDQQKASSLSLYGNPVCRTPHLEAFAQDACLFTRAYTSCPLCVPARVSLFTGQLPSVHGSLNNNILLEEGRDTLLSLLKDQGYVTGLTGKNHCFREPDLKQFDYCRLASHYGPIDESGGEYREANEFLNKARELKAAWGSVANPFPPETLGTAWTTDRAMEFVHAHREEPFFLWFSISDPHIPFQTSEPYASLYPPESVDMPLFRENEMEGKPKAQEIDYRVMRGDQVSEETIRNVRAMYYGMNTYIDDQLGRFFGRLKELGLYDDSLIVYVSDHGEYLGEHKMIRKSKAAYDALIHIPFIIKCPGATAGDSDAIVSLEDILPTVCESLGIEIPRGVNGKSLVPILSGASSRVRSFMYGEYGGHNYPWNGNQAAPECEGPLTPDFNPRNKKGGFGKMRYIRDHRWKLTSSVDDGNELYDLEKDPYELMNLYQSPEHQDRVREMLERLTEQMMMAANPKADAGDVS